MPIIIFYTYSHFLIVLYQIKQITIFYIYSNQNIIIKLSRLLYMQVQNISRPALFNNSLNQPSNQQALFDGFFYNSLQQAKSNFYKYSLYNSLKLITLSIFVAVYYSKHPQLDLFIPFILAIVHSICSIITFLLIIQSFNNLKIGIQVGLAIGHVKIQKTNKIGKQTQIIRSQIYDFTNSISVDLPQQHRVKFQKAIGNTLYKQYLQNSWIVSKFYDLTYASSIGLVIYFIIGLAKFPKTPQTTGLAITYIVFQMLSKVQIYLLLIIFALSPLICIGFCFYCCCCAKTQQQVQLPQIPVLKYKPTSSSQATQCSICYQSFGLDDEVKTLPCDSKHTYHKMCIQSWLRVSSTCPLCRKNLAI